MAANCNDIYQTVTDHIIAQLAEGVRPWLKPWNAEHAAGRICRPLRANGTPYRGINVILLWMAAEAKGYAAPLWMTYRQAGELGGQVRKGEKACPVTYADKIKREDESEVWFLKSYSVFNVEQIDGLPERFHATTNTQPLDPLARIERADAFFNAIPACVTHGGNRAYYSHSTHHVQMPPFETFRAPTMCRCLRSRHSAMPKAITPPSPMS